MNALDLKAEVRGFWDAVSCGEVYAEDLSAQEQFRKQAEARYRLEPYIRSFARFEEGASQDVLEIGVGMAADHLEWARSRPRRLAGIDLTPRAVAWTAQRLVTYGYESELEEGAAESLAFADNSFDIVYSWGVLHHSSDTPAAFREAHRVFRPGGTLRVMICHRPSIVGLMLRACYGLAMRYPARSLTNVYARHLESRGTKGYALAEARRLGRAVRRLPDPRGSQLRGLATRRGGSAPHWLRARDRQAALATAAGPPVAGARVAAPDRGPGISASSYLWPVSVHDAVSTILVAQVP
jgi:ubiquinone/menaquinone biosynthesis C-methylase UbiE